MQPFNDLILAPPVKVVDGMVAVPIDIQNLNANIIFDVESRRATVEAEMIFVMGKADGNAVFDLRQDIIKASLNDTPIDLNKLRHHNFGGGPDSDLIIVESLRPMESKNTLRLSYELKQPKSPGSQPIAWDPSRLYYEFWFTDLQPARYLEMWLPSNLIYDQFKISVEITIINCLLDHALFTNGQVNKLNQNHWKVEFPQRFTSLSPMLCIVALDRIEYRHGSMLIPGTDLQVLVDTFKMRNTSLDLQKVENDVKAYLTKNIAEIGPYIHGNRFTTFLWQAARSMEYEGGVTTSMDALKHEVFHSWFGRGVRPSSQNDGWIDEAWNVYNTRDNHMAEPFSISDNTTTLCSSNPFNRVTPQVSYDYGARFFDSLASYLGVENLISYMNSFYNDNKNRLITTQQLESHLIEKSGMVKIAQYFKQFVYGRKNNI
jgi:hypothetical protein